MKTDCTAFINQELTWLYERVVSWLHFAEAKNAAIITLSSALTLSMLQRLVSEDCSSSLCHFPVLIVLGTASVSVLVSVVTFLPNTRRKDFEFDEAAGNPSEQLNPYFFGNIARMNSDSLIEYLARYSDDETAIEAHSHERLSHLAEQVIINSRITMQKLKFFNFAVANLFVGAFLAVATALVIIAMRTYGTASAFG